MGIPGFYKRLSERYPKIVETTYPSNKVVFLYLDINALFHVALHKKQVKKQPKSPRQMLSEVFKEMDCAIEYCNPQFVYIAMDGVAPRAKMNEQRSRRYLHQNDDIDSTNSSSNINGSENLEFFVPINSVAITPGTDFMAAANEAIKFYIYQRLNGKYKALQIIFNDSKVPGEGEHKIFRYLNTQPGHDPNNQHIVYGNDADFIMYALLTHKPNIRILRNNGDYIIVNIYKLRKHILVDMVGNRREIDENNLIDDFACLVNLFGNDFMPKLKHIGEASISILFKACLRYFNMIDSYCITNSLISENLGEVTLENRANDYLKTMLWSVLYHNGSCPSWRFFYPYHKSPTMNEILKYVNPRIFNPTFTSDFPMNPFEQLVCIIPPSSSYLLPESLRDLLTDPESPLKDFFPKNYPKTNNGASLPFIEEKILIESVQKRYQYIDENDLKRNSLDGKIHIFSGCRSKTYSIVYPLCTSFDARITMPNNSIILGRLNHDGCMLKTIETPVNGWNSIRNNSVAFAEYNLLNQL